MSTHIWRLMHAAGAPALLIGASHETIAAFDWQRCTQALDSGRGIYLHGKVGCGKSFLAAALLRNAIEQCADHSVDEQHVQQTMQFIGANELICELRASFGRCDESDIAIIDRCSNYKLLVFDDLGVNKPTEYVVQAVDMIIDFRYQTQHSRQTIITSNLSLDRLSAKYDDRIASRIAGMCEVIELIGDDRRMRE